MVVKYFDVLNIFDAIFNQPKKKMQRVETFSSYKLEIISVNSNTNFLNVKHMIVIGMRSIQFHSS